MRGILQEEWEGYDSEGLFNRISFYFSHNIPEYFYRFCMADLRDK
jgi:hypothetical protein